MKAKNELEKNKKKMSKSWRALKLICHDSKALHMPTAQIKYTFNQRLTIYIINIYVLEVIKFDSIALNTGKLFKNRNTSFYFLF